MIKREYHLDFLRVFACFLVIVIHVSAQNWLSVAINSPEWNVFNIYDSLARCAVPLFFMLSGCLFLSKPHISIKNLYLKNILRLVLVYFFWSLLYAMDAIGPGELVRSFDLRQLVWAILDSKYHLWYLQSQISVYLLFPILWVLKEYKEGKYLEYFCVVWLIFAVMRSSILLAPLPVSAAVLLKKFTFPLGSFCGYFALGYLLSKYKEKLKRINRLWYCGAFVVCSAATALFTSMTSIKSGLATESFYGSFTVFTFIAAVSVFCFFQSFSGCEPEGTKARAVEKISKYTFFTYLFHVFVLEFLEKHFSLNSLSFSSAMSVPVISLLIFVLCMSVAFIIDRIPVLRKLLL